LNSKMHIMVTFKHPSPSSLRIRLQYPTECKVNPMF